MSTQWLWFLVGVGASVLLGGGGWWLRQWQQWRRYGDPHLLDAQLQRYYHQMAGSSGDRQALVQLLTEEIPHALGIRQATLLFVEDHQLVGQADWQLALHNAAVRHVAASGSAMPVMGELQRLIQQNRLDLQWSRVWTPLMRSSNLHGVWLLGSRQDGRTFTASQLQALTTLARQAALILETVQHAQQAQETAQQIQSLYQQTVSASEMERSRLARELHDGVLQEMCAMARDLKGIAHRTPPPDATLAGLVSYADEAVSALRDICHNLRPPLLTSNLALALQALVERTNSHSPTPISFKSKVEELHLPDEAAIAIYRIAQEAINNAVKHAAASEILVRLTQYPAAIHLSVSDDGCGIANPNETAGYVAQGHYGLAGMRERARMIDAQLAFHSAREYGTAVILQVPVIAHCATTSLPCATLPGAIRVADE